VDPTGSKTQHDYAVYLFQQGFYADAVSQLDELLHTEETAERWSDWATAQYGLNQFAEAERGFRRALELDPGISDAAVNFGMLLSSQARYGEALELFEKALLKLEGEGRTAVQNFIQQCRAQLHGASPRPTRKKQPGKARKTKAKR
jgi:Tfp pilus assembly protein PilF